MRNIKSSYWMLTLSLALPLNACKSIKDNSASKRPNIIFILADDMGYGDIKSYNPASRIPTPSLDSMANMGIRFTDAHTNSSVSTPTRYGILTGRYAFRSQLKKGVLTGYSTPLIEEGRETIASFLKKNDYQTACVGKWHLGLDWVKKDQQKPLYTGTEWDVKDTKNVDYTAYIGGGPTNCGFDYSYILPASLDMPPYAYIENGKIAATVGSYTEDYADASVRGARYRHGDVANDFDHKTCLDNLTQKSEEYIARASKQNKPYFLYFALTAPHAPWLLQKEFEGRSSVGAYGDFVCMVDEMVRRIYAAVEQSGKAENTLIIFMSDNGAMWLEEDILQTSHHANGAWSGAKSDLWEGGHRVPLLMTWPAVIAAGTHSDQLISSTDLFATFANALGKTLPSHVAEDSFSFFNAIAKKGNRTDNSTGRESLVSHSVNGYFSLRRNEWVLIDCKGSGGWALPEDKACLLSDVQLYNLKNDTTQKKNVQEVYPEIVRKMKAELESIKNRKGSK